jgi:hypothetical protein
VKRAFLFPLGGALIIAVALISGCIAAGGGISRPLRYELPEHYQGWVLIQYSSPGCEPMTANGLGEIIIVPDGGRACTSSPPRVGWHPVEYANRSPNGSRVLDDTRITVKSSQPACSREEFYVREPGQDSIPPEPADWGFCAGR